MSRTFESCLKALPQGCANCVLADECAEKQLYNKGRADGINECKSKIDTLEQISFGIVESKLVKGIFEQLKEQKNEQRYI